MRLWIALFVSALPLWPQNQTVSTRIFTEPPGAVFVVDGQKYTSSATFFWPERSKHLVSIKPWQDVIPGVRLVASGWENALGEANPEGLSFILTASAGVPWYKANLTLSHAVTLQFSIPTAGRAFACSPGPNYGKVYVGDNCYAQNATIWFPAETEVTMQAFPPPGFVFHGWEGTAPNSIQQSASFVLKGPVLLIARFRRALEVKLETTPPRLAVFADRARVATPIRFEWGVGSTHQIGAVSPQWDSHGAPWIFESWSDGGAEHHAFDVPVTPAPVVLTAKYVPAVPFGLVTSPPGLELMVDGRSDWPGYNFLWAQGSRHTIAAPAEQTDSAGRRHVFRSWAHGGEAAQELVAQSPGGWSARYETLGRVTIRSTNGEVPLVVDGVECRTPCVVHRLSGTQVALAAPETSESGDGRRLRFQGWADGGTAGRSIVMDGQDRELYALYSAEYRLWMLAEPAGTGEVRCEPTSADGYYPAGTRVAVYAVPSVDYMFRRWEGDVTGAFQPGWLTLGGPRTVLATFEPDTTPRPPRIRNAAGETPEEGVAPGSIVAALGKRLAETSETGPRSPLAQSLAGVSLTVGDRILGLFSVTPEQINALLPSDLPEGEYDFTVRRAGMDDVATRFTVVRNAPGLFARPEEPYALAAHSSGTAITKESPAEPGETITVYGTGLGPYDGHAIDGFPVPEWLALKLVDPVEVLIGGQAIEPAFAGAAAGQIGVVAVRFQVPEGLPAAAELRVRVNGRESNGVLLPVVEKPATE